jgi:hypothetical protein
MRSSRRLWVCGRSGELDYGTGHIGILGWTRIFFLGTWWLRIALFPYLLQQIRRRVLMRHRKTIHMDFTWTLYGLTEIWTCYRTQQEGEVLHMYLHREPHSSGQFDMQLVYEDMPQESSSYQCRAAHISATGWANGDRYGDEYGWEYGRQVCIYTGILASRDQSIKSKKHPK